MRETAKSLIETVLAYNTLIFYVLVALVVIIILSFGLSAWRRREQVSFYLGDTPDDPPSSSKQPVTVGKLDYFVDVFGRRLLMGMLVSGVLLFLACAPLLAVRLFV